MDIASGMTEDRKAEIAKQAETATLETFLNFSWHFDGIASELDLGNAFRAKPTSDVPVLLLSGTLDGRTYIESQLEAVSALTYVTSVTVENGGHNIYDIPSSEVRQTIGRFLEGKPVTRTVITVELPDFSRIN